MLEKYMQQYEKELELDKPLIRPNPGIYYIPLDVQLHMTISAIPGGFSLYSELIELPKENEEFTYTQCLIGNLFGQGTRGSILGINDRGNMLTISRVVDYNMEYKDFKELVEDFISTIDFWRDQISSQKPT